MSDGKLTSPSGVRAWIAEHQFLPSKVLGQNFLIDENILRIMVDAAQLSADDRVLEIGPGLGMVTNVLLDRVATVIAVEKDKRLFAYLSEVYHAHPRLALIHGDALEINLGDLVEQKKIGAMIANLPYSVASRIMVELFKLPHGLHTMVITVQREVAERMCAAVDTNDYGLLSIWAQLDYDVRIAKRIAPSCFHPRPQVTSAIVQLRHAHNRRAKLRNPELFDRLIKHAFSHRRKQIGTILHRFHAGGAAGLAQANIEPKRRPETIRVEEWIMLADALSGRG